MKHEFEDSTIIKAHTQAVKNLSYVPDRISTTYLRGLLGALPEPQDDWQECAFEDIRKGDRVKVVDDYGEKVYEKTVIMTYQTQGERSIRTTEYRPADVVPGDATFYRIPAPVVHPNPDFHPVVISSVGDAWVWDDADEHYIEIGGGGHRGSGDFGSGWVSGKVVADDEM